MFCCRETVMLVNVCGALAYALMKPWFPDSPKEPDSAASPAPSQSPVSKKGSKATKDAKTKPSTTQITINPEALPDLKRAIEVCFYSMADFKSRVDPPFQKLCIEKYGLFHLNLYPQN